MTRFLGVIVLGALAVARPQPALGIELFVSDGRTNTVGRVSPSGAVTPFASDLSQPLLVLAPDGDLFVANYAGGLDDGSSSISRVTPDGAVSPFITDLNGAFPLTIDAAGNLYVGLASDDEVLKVTSAGAVTPFANGFDEPVGLAFGPDGYLYVSNHLDGKISRVSPGGVVSDFVSGLDFPNDIEFDSSGNLYVAIQAGPDAGVDRIDSAGAISPFARGIPGGPAGLTLAGDGNLYVVGLFGQEIYRVTPEGVVEPFAGGFLSAREPADLPLAAAGVLLIFALRRPSRQSL
jgi:sugar lactone lactonase YvrE